MGDTPIDGPLCPGYPGHMSAQAQAILEQALRLSADDRAHLADALQRSLEAGASGLPPDEATRLWAWESILDRRPRGRSKQESSQPRLVRGVQAGTNPKVMAREIQQSIGLTAYLEIIEGVLYTMTQPRARHRDHRRPLPDAGLMMRRD